MHHLFAVHPLEARQLLSGSFASLNAHGTLSVVGTAAKDVITISVQGNQIVAKLNGASLSFAKSSVKRITARGFGGNDSISNKTTLPSTLTGDSGNDSLTGGSNADDLQPGSGANLIDSGGGKDTIDYSDQPATDFDIDNNPDLLPPGAQGVTINQDLVLHSRGDVLLGTPHNDSFFGTLYNTLDMTIAGGDGDDEMGIFVDQLFPDDGGITLDGGNGNDSFGTGDTVVIPDKIIGGPGNDYLQDDVFLASDVHAIEMGPGHDTVEEIQSPVDEVPVLYCGAGVEDLIVDEVGPYKLIGNDLNNSISVPSSGGSTLIGGEGNDTLDCLDVSPSEGAAPNFIFGGDGNDKLLSNSNFGLQSPTQTVMKGENGNDTLDGSGGANRILDGGAGNDLLIPTAVDDDFGAKLVKTTLIGGAGHDTADFSHDSLPVKITLDNKANDGPAGAMVNVHNDIETILGGHGNDFIQAGNSAAKLVGNAGNDSLIGGSKSDTLVGGPGKDTLLGNGGNDILFAKDGQRDSLDGGSGFDQAQRDKSASVSDLVLNVEAFL